MTMLAALEPVIAAVGRFTASNTGKAVVSGAIQKATQRPEPRQQAFAAGYEQQNQQQVQRQG